MKERSTYELQLNPKTVWQDLGQCKSPKSIINITKIETGYTLLRIVKDFATGVKPVFAFLLFNRLLGFWVFINISYITKLAKVLPKERNLVTLGSKESLTNKQKKSVTRIEQWILVIKCFNFIIILTKRGLWIKIMFLLLQMSKKPKKRFCKIYFLLVSYKRVCQPLDFSSVNETSLCLCKPEFN